MPNDKVEVRSLFEIKKRRIYLENVLRNTIGLSKHRDWLESEIAKEKFAQQEAEKELI